MQQDAFTYQHCTPHGHLWACAFGSPLLAKRVFCTSTAYYGEAESPLGIVRIAWIASHICYIHRADNIDAWARWQKYWSFTHTEAADPKDMLQRIFAIDPSTPLTLRVVACGSPFQLKVWSVLTQVPRGHTCSYSALAACIGAPGAARAVGTALGCNPLLYILPCHRVVPKDFAVNGDVGQFAGGKALKEQLLQEEKP